MLKNSLCWLLAGGLLLAGCGGKNQKSVRSEEAALRNAPASMEEVFKGKTAGGKPVRAYKITLQAPYGEHLLLVLGDPSVPVSMSTAAAVKIGGKDQESPYLYTGNGMVFVAKTDGASLWIYPLAAWRRKPGLLLLAIPANPPSRWRSLPRKPVAVC
jgi:hypothetical protein